MVTLGPLGAPTSLAWLHIMDPDEWNSSIIKARYVGMWEIRPNIPALRAKCLVLDSSIS